MAAMRIANIAGRGLGVIAARLLKPGQVILQETPLVRVSKDAGSAEMRAHPVASALMGRVIQLASSGEFDPKSDFSSWPDEVRECMEGVLDVQAEVAYEKLPKDVQDRWMELQDVHADAAAGGGKTPGGVLRTNSIDDDEGFANLYSQLSRINHSCDPNAVRLQAGGSGGVCVVASRSVSEGEEVLMNYMDGADDGLSVDQRRQHLQQQYHFHCTCSLCVKESP